MATQNLSGHILKTASCPTLGDWAIAKGYRIAKNPKHGDLVLYDFNNNGTSDHIGIVDEVISSTKFIAIEGNTGNGSNTNGDGVYRRTRYTSSVNYFVRITSLSEKERDLIVKTAKAQIGYKEGSNNNNKYGAWFGQNYVSWCCIFVVWCFAHCIKPTPKTYTGAYPNFTVLSRDILNQIAKECSWKKGTSESKYKYIGGSSYGKFKHALNEAYPNREHWSARPKVGASCDVAVGTIVRYSELDEHFPRGLSEQLKYSSKSFKRIHTYKADKMRSGDIIIYNRKGSGSHILMVVEVNGVKYRYEANYGVRGKEYARYAHRTAKLKDFNASSYSKFIVLRANKPIRNKMIVGDKGGQVKRLQKYLKWYGTYTGEIDGIYGKKTAKAVSEFRVKVGLTAGDEFGSKCLKKARKAKR